MAKKSRVPPPPPPRAAEPERSAVTPERFTRLYHLLRLLEEGPQTRAVLIRRLRLDVRGFYRDLELLRASDIVVSLFNRRYALEQDAEDAIERLPFPDPHLTLGEAQRLAKGRSQLHRKLQELIGRVVS